MLLLCVFCASALTYRIDLYNIRIIGRTRESAVRRLIGNDEGTVVSDRDELVEMIERKRQTLLDQRLFKDVEISWSEGPVENGCIPVTVDIFIDGAFSFIVLPSISYDSNTGFSASFFLEDQNFLGSTGSFSFYFSVSENDNIHDLSRTDVNSYMRLNIPVGKKWNYYSNLYFTHSGLDCEDSSFSLHLKMEEKRSANGHFSEFLYFSFATESKERSGFRRFSFISDRIQFSFSDILTWNISEDITLGTDAEDKFSSLSYIYWVLEKGKIMGLNLTPTLRFNVLAESGKEVQPSLWLMLNIEGSLIDWYGDFRSGYSILMDARISTDGNQEFTGDISFFKTPVSWLQLSARLTYRFSTFPDKNQTNRFTSELRGVRDDNVMIQDQPIEDIAALNLDAHVFLLRIPKFVNIYVGSFVDVGFVGPDGFMACSGIEMIFILDEWPGSPGRLTYARNLTNPTEFEFSAYGHFFY